MTKPKQAPKTPQQLANEHWEWIEGLVFTQMKLTMKLFMDGFVHGYEHRDKEIRNGNKQNIKRI